MLTEEQNRTLTQTGRGTPMGELLRRYWMPIAAVSEFETISIKPVRLMGEDLVLYKDLGGRFGLVERHCPHRRADLSYGFVEDCGIRCNYHGWLFDEQGRCIEQPFEDAAHPEARFRDKVRARAYRVEPKAGLLWAYLGPDPVPLIPDWETYHYPNGFVQIVFSHVPCNWFQCQENSIDPVHFEWMHRNWSVRLKGQRGPYGNKHLKIDFKEFEYGFTYHRLVEGMPDDHERWTIGRICLWPNCLGPLSHFEWRVPIDDENTLSVGWFYSRVPKEREPYVQASIPSWEAAVADPLTGRWYTSHIMNQDYVAWVGQGAIADRSKEHIGPSDVGVIAIRKRFFDDLKRIEQGLDPKGIIRDPAINHNIQLPIVDRQLLLDGATLPEMLTDPSLDPRRGFQFLVGQPARVKAEFLAAMGLDGEHMEDKGAGLLAEVAGQKTRRIWA